MMETKIYSIFLFNILAITANFLVFNILAPAIRTVAVWIQQQRDMEMLGRILYNKTYDGFGVKRLCVQRIVVSGNVKRYSVGSSLEQAQRVIKPGQQISHATITICNPCPNGYPTRRCHFKLHTNRHAFCWQTQRRI